MDSTSSSSSSFESVVSTTTTGTGSSSSPNDNDESVFVSAADLAADNGRTSKTSPSSLSPPPADADDSSCAEKAADSTATADDADDGDGQNEEENAAPLIEGLPKPSSALEKVDFVRDSHNRVKLYVLCDQRAWDDKGTGHVACFQSPDNPNNWCIIVRLETNERNVLESRVQLDTIYQKQQGTLIVWSESDSVDLALSFQEKTGCTELWEKICKIQGKDPDADAEEENECASDQDAPSDSSTSGLSNACGGNIPPCNLQCLNELEQAMSSSMFANSQREKMANAILHNGYIQKLCELFEMCEDLDNTEALHHLASIAKNLFLLNNNGVLNELVEDKYFKNIVGMLEHDPAFPVPRKHREFLWERSKFNEVLPLSSGELKEKIHQTFRLQYVQDVCLPAPSIFEENLLTVLTSHLFFIRAEIVNSLLNDKELMKKLFDELRTPGCSPERQRDLTNFLKEFCSFAHSLQPTGPQGREQFFKTLMANDVLSAIDPCISSDLPSTRTATVELLTIIVDFNPQLFRDFLVKQFRQIPESKNSTLLINKLINHMLDDPDAEFTAASQISQVLRILLDPESIVAKGEKGEFLQMFYKRAMLTLCAPIVNNATKVEEEEEQKAVAIVSDTYYMANKIALVIDLLCFFVEHHSYNMRAYTIQKGLLQQVLVYLKSKHHFLVHCALRILRRIIGLKDDIYNRHICDKGILDLVVDCFVANGERYNLLNSSLIELFEYIRTEEIRPLMQYAMQKHWDDTFSKITYVRTFAAMKMRCDQFADPSKSFSSLSSADSDSALKENLRTALAMTPPNAQWRKEREHDDEELFFSKEEDEEMPAPQFRKNGVEPLFPSLSRKRKANEEDNMASVFGGNITPPAGSTITGRMSKIVIRMASKEPLRFQSSSLDDDNKQHPNSSANKMAAVEKPSSSSSASAPELPFSSDSKITTTTTTIMSAATFVAVGGGGTTQQQEAAVAVVSSSSQSSSSSSLKRPLVDYEDSDDEEDEEEAAAAISSGGGPPNERGRKREGERMAEPSPPLASPGKIPKLALAVVAESTTEQLKYPSSPPPDPEQQRTDDRRERDISA